MLEPVAIKYRLTDGCEITESELYEKLNSGELEYGPFESFAAGVGNISALVLPPLNIANVSFKVIEEIIKSKNYSEKNKQKLVNLLNENLYLKYHLIDMLLPRPHYAKTQLFPLIESFKQKNLRDLVQFLLQCGACYEHLFLSAQLSVDDLHVYVIYFGEEVLNIKIFNMSLLMLLFMNRATDFEQILQKLKYLITKGCNLNYRHPQDGTFLHIRVANEGTSISFALQAIDYLEECQPGKFDYSLQDGEGKTLLLLAAKLGQVKLVEKLMALQKSGINIGIDIPDDQGRTPLLIAIALGHEEIVQYLLMMGARIDITDNEARGLPWYLTASSEVVSQLLKSIHIEPGRHFNAPHNWLYFNDTLNRPLMYSKSKEAEKRVLIAKQNPHWQLINEVLEEAKKQDENLWYNILQQIKPLSGLQGITVLENCLAKREAVKAIVKSHLERILLYSCALGDIESIKMLFAWGVDIEAKDDLDRTCLHYAVMRQKLVEDIRQTTKSNRTISACMHGHLEVFKFLISQNANLWAKNKNGNSTVDLIKRDRSMVGAELSSSNKDVMRKIADELKIDHKCVGLLGVLGLFSSMPQWEQNAWNEQALKQSSEPPSASGPVGAGYGF